MVMPNARMRRGIAQSLGLCLVIAFARQRAARRRIASATRAGGDAKRGRRGGDYTLNEVPQPQVVLALGLLNTNPLPFSPPE